MTDNINESCECAGMLTMPISHEQHCMVNHPGIAEDLQGVRHPFSVELRDYKGFGRLDAGAREEKGVITGKSFVNFAPLTSPRYNDPPIP